MNKKHENFSLVKIGTLINRDFSATIKLEKDYIKGLKHLDLFSHIIIFINDDNKINYKILKIDNINFSEGTIKVNKINISNNSILYDIKPYFGCEDRVQESKCRFDLQDSKISNIIDNKTNINNKIILKIKPIGYYKYLSKKQSIIFENKFNFKKLYNFSHGRVLWWFNRFDNDQYRKTLLCSPPYQNAPVTGTFATRSPVRPNPIATTIVKILEIDENSNRILIEGFDGFENSIIFDLVPYISKDEYINSSYEPYWLENWPKWKSFNNIKLDKNIKLVNSDLKRLKTHLNIESSNFRTPYSKKTVSINNTKSDNCISVHNANENNLNNVNIDIPKNKITVISGVSGSGKSTLAFDVIYAESQREFIEIVGSDRNNTIEKPNVDKITGLQPSIAIEQKTLSRNPRSTVGTITGISDHLRQLFSTIGIPHCPECNTGIEILKKEEIYDLILNIKNESSIEIYPHSKEENKYKIKLDKNNLDKGKNIIEKCLEEGKETIYICINNEKPFLLQTKNYCYTCNRIFFDVTPSTFSFNNPDYMCENCKGLGVELSISKELIIDNEDISILDGAIKFYGNLRKHAKKPNANWMRGEALALAYDLNVDLELPYKDLPSEYKHQLFNGSNGRKVTLTYENSTGRKGEICRPVEGILNVIERLYTNNKLENNNGIAENFMEKKTCSKCNGERLNEEARLIEISGIRYPIASKMSINQLRNWIINLHENLPLKEFEISVQLLERIENLLGKIIDVGLSYLTLDRVIPTLSGGESQRLRLASQFGTNLTNILYVLDEPSMGLHPKDYKYLISKIDELKNSGNTILMVEHEKDMILSADYLVDIGPSAGKYGGNIIATGNIEEIINNKESITGQYLVNNKLNSIATSKKENTFIEIDGVKENNLKNLNVKIPLNSFVCITGVSGSGKSSLISKTFYPAVAKKLGHSVESIGKYDNLCGYNKVNDIILVSQEPIGRTPRSNPSTYTGVFDFIRELYAQLDLSKKRKYKKDHFSFNGKKGQCSVCSGIGKIQTVMSFLPDIWTKCTTCNGKRYQSDILDVKYKNLSISDILELDIDSAFKVFNDVPKINNILKMLCDIGLGYIKLGQSALTLSGGEAQRIKLAKELSSSNKSNVIYILDEPTTGLHFKDIDNLIKIINKLVINGNSIIAIEHNIDFIKSSDWIIDLGPSGGDDGGYLIAEGTPQNVSKNSNSITGQILKNLFFE